jgi:hypothetical protein
MSAMFEPETPAALKCATGLVGRRAAPGRRMLGTGR